MQPLPRAFVSKLDLRAAVTEESVAWRNLIPVEPGWTALANDPDRVASFVGKSLMAGHDCPASKVITARKAGHGTRPVPVMGMLERIAYRALARAALDGVELPDRSAEAYAAFLRGPIEYAFGEAGWIAIGAASLEYVVEADVNAFYQYVDHDVLRRELQIQSENLEAIDALVELLGETEGRRFGLPQLLDPSDWLSEVYVRIVERDVLRLGFPIWRFNDDFRIGCRTYAEALDGIERLEESLRRVGLTLGAHKTYTPSFVTYLAKTTSLDVSDTTREIDPSDVEVIVTDYPHLDEDAAIDSARATLARLEPTSTDAIDLKNARGDEIRDLRRAIAALTKYVDPGGLPWASRLFVFIPSLSPRLAGYLSNPMPPFLTRSRAFSTTCAGRDP